MWDGQNLISPAKFSGLKVWLDASQITGLNDGDAVTTWTDLSGNGNSPTQETADLKPIYKTNIKNGLPVVRFDGSNDYLRYTYAAEYSQPNTIITVVKMTNEASTNFVYDGVVDAKRHTMNIEVATKFLQGYSGGTGTKCYDKNFINNFCILTHLYKGTSSFLKVNKKLLGRGNAGTDGNTGITVGARVNNAQPAAMDLCEFIYYNKELSSYEIYQLENYLAKKWGIKCASIVVLDNFTRSNNNSSMGNADSNHAWNAGSYDTTDLPTIGISGNKGYFPACSGTDSHAWVETNKADCSIACRYNYAGDDDKGIVFRRVDANNYFYLHANSAADTVTLSRCLAGVRSDLGSLGISLTSVNENILGVYLSGDSITCWSSLGYGIISVTDANLQTATKHGIYNAADTDPAFSYFAVEEA